MPHRQLSSPRHTFGFQHLSGSFAKGLSDSTALGGLRLGDWWTDGATAAAHYFAHRYMAGEERKTELEAQGTIRAAPSTSYAENPDGTLQAFSANTSRITGTGQLIEGSDKNSILQSEDFTTTWAGSATVSSNSNIAPNGELTADTLTDGNSSGFSNVSQSITISSSTDRHIFSIRVKKTVGGTSPTFGVNHTLTGGTTAASTARLNTDTGAVFGGGAIEALDSGDYWIFRTYKDDNGTGNTSWKIEIFPATSANGGGSSDDSTATGSAVVWGAMARTGLAAGAPEASYIPTTTAAVTRDPDNTTLVREENLVKLSEDFTDGVWIKTGCTVTTGTSPLWDRPETSYRMIESTTSLEHGISQAVAVTIGQVNTLIVEAAAGAGTHGTHLDLHFWNNSDTNTTTSAIFDLVNGTIGGTRGSDATITSLGDGWYRCTLTGTSLGSTLSYRIQNSDGVNQTYPGDGVSYLNIGRVQINTGSTALPYTKTTSSAISLPFKGFNASEGTFVFEFMYDSASVLSTGPVFSVADSAAPTANRIDYRTQFSVVGISSGGTTIATLFMASPTDGQRNKIAIAYKVNDFAASINGGGAVADTAGSVPVGMNKMMLGTLIENPSAHKLGNYIKSWEYFPTRKSNAELQTLSTL